MLGSMITLVLVALGAVLVLCIMIFGIYVTFYPMLKTLAGARDVMKEQKDAEATEEDVIKRDEEPPPMN